MRFILIRIWRAARWYGLSWYLIGLIGAVVTVSSGGFSWQRPPYYILLPLGVLFVAAFQYRRTSTVRRFDSIVPALLASRQDFCLLLRPFGNDGETLLLRTKEVGSTMSFRVTRTAEQAVGEAVRSALSLPVVAVVDQSTSFSPRGVTYISATNSEWQDVVAQLIRNARVIVVLVPPDGKLRYGFTWEVDQIIAAGRQRRVVVFAAPATTYDGASFHSALARALWKKLSFTDTEVDESNRPGQVGMTGSNGNVLWSSPFGWDGEDLLKRAGGHRQQKFSTCVSYDACVQSISKALSDVEKGLAVNDP